MQYFDFDVIWRSLPFLLGEGLVFTLKLTITSAILGLFFGAIIAAMRLSGSRWLSTIAAGYVNFMRSVPLLLGIFWFYFLVPYIGAWILQANRPLEVGATISVFVTFAAFEAAYFSETIRAGIQSISTGQMSAAKALGMSYLQQMVIVILPQAIRRMMPIILTQVIVLFQDTSLVYVLSLNDFLGTATKIAQRDGRLVEMYLFVAAFFFVTCFLSSLLVKRLQRNLTLA